MTSLFQEEVEVCDAFQSLFPGLNCQSHSMTSFCYHIQVANTPMYNLFYIFEVCFFPVTQVLFQSSSFNEVNLFKPQKSLPLEFTFWPHLYSNSIWCSSIQWRRNHGSAGCWQPPIDSPVHVARRYANCARKPAYRLEHPYKIFLRYCNNVRASVTNRYALLHT